MENQPKKNNNATTQKIRSVIMTEAGIVITIVSLVVSVLLFVMLPVQEIKQDFAVFKTDVSHDLDTLVKAVEKIEDKDEKQDEALVLIKESVASILSILNGRR